VSIIEELKDKARSIGVLDGGRLAVCDVLELHRAIEALDDLFSHSNCGDCHHHMTSIRDFFQTIVEDSESFAETQKKVLST
jgi:hypothetical protein